MSLQSAWELSQDAAFKGKVLIALGRAAKKVIDENSNADNVRIARSVLGRLTFFVEAVTASVAAEKDIDSSSNDEAILKAAQKALLELVA